MSTELRLLLAIVLSFLIFFVYQALFMEGRQVHKVAPETKAMPDQSQTPTAQDRVKPVQDIPVESVQPPESRETGAAPVSERTITVSTDLYVAQLSEKNGAIKTFKLKKYRESIDPSSPMKELILLRGTPDAASPIVSFLASNGHLFHLGPFQADISEDALDASEKTRSLQFIWRSPQGISMVKTYAFHPKTYEIGLEIKVANLSGKPLDNSLAIALRTLFDQSKSSRYAFSGPAAFIDGELKEIKVKNIAKQPSLAGKISWIANEDQYFATAVVPETPRKARVHLAIGDDNVLQATYVDPAESIAPRMERTYRYRLYFGPKSLEALRHVGSDLSKMLDFGFFDLLAKPLLYIMNQIYHVMPNYGIAIILITIVVKLLFWPLSNKSYQSMSQMKRLQPKMAEIRAKYKNDKKMMNQELMNLYKLYKVNPLGGCLPMVLQIPVFFAFYRMLYQAIELRQAPFFWWINDLAAPDRLGSFDIKIPLMAPPYGIPVLTLIMGASMFLQQKMSPPPGDPAQAKMMMFMPIFFTFIFVNFPSGLVLYWLVNNILSIAQQYYITKKTV